MDPEAPEHPRAGCMECKAPRPVVSWGLCGVAALAVASVLCRACRERDPHLRTLCEVA